MIFEPYLFCQRMLEPALFPNWNFFSLGIWKRAMLIYLCRRDLTVC